MRMLSAWRQRGILRRELLNLAFQFSDPRLVSHGSYWRISGPFAVCVLDALLAATVTSKSIGADHPVAAEVDGAQS